MNAVQSVILARIAGILARADIVRHSVSPYVVNPQGGPELRKSIVISQSDLTPTREELRALFDGIEASGIKINVA